MALSPIESALLALVKNELTSNPNAVGNIVGAILAQNNVSPTTVTAVTTAVTALLPPLIANIP